MGKDKIEIENARASSTRFLWIIISWGAILRLTEYLSDRSLWYDEATLVDNVINRSFHELLRPLDSSTAPLGFLMLERSAIRIFGTSEYALRLFPLFCGIVSLLLFCRVAETIIAPSAVPIAVGLFAISGPLIYYSSEVKQYSSDVVIAIALLWAAIYYRTCRLTLWRAAVFGVVGAASIWLSHSAVFVLAGVGISLASFCLVRRRWPRLARLSIAYSLWTLSLAASYVVSLRGLNNNRTLLAYWSFGFIPSPLLSLATIEWFIRTFFGIFWSPLGLELSGIAAAAFLIGCISMFVSRREELLILVSPIFPTLLAAGLRKYPFNGRLILFIVPVLLLLIAYGADQIRLNAAPTIGACMIGLLFLHPLLFSTYHLIKPSASELPPGIAHTREEIKPILRYIEKHQLEEDLLYVDDGARPAFQYYAARFPLKKLNVILGRMPDDRQDCEKNCENDLDQLRGYRRVWLLFSHSHSLADIDEEKLFLYLLDQKGRKLDSFKTTGSAVYLYDLH